ncbi:hypothetical protein [Cytobacillus purgationiresistens]|uniref:GNAT family N-acetyltransferase n=1 Tax=Cytobacillus purgationiresistens TaxID=863449 RepID=A0ABU0AI63_9BACI|nr:hypothetical protein [Cytobacillus purgationiresistens]MDQ0270942.1 hypothetical protein [Cytobacillus purgationiresistens]
MFEIVTSSRQQKSFEEIWEYFCEMYGWYNDPYAKNGIRYNLLLPQAERKVIGTIEFVPYKGKHPNSTVENHFRFSRLKKIQQHQKRVWEIDKLCLHKDFQRRGYFENFGEAFYHHAQTHKPKYYIAMMEKRFFRMMRILFGLNIIQVGQSIEMTGTSLIPVVCDMERIMQNEEMVRVLFKKELKLKKADNKLYRLKRLFIKK